MTPSSSRSASRTRPRRSQLRERLALTRARVRGVPAGRRRPARRSTRRSSISTCNRTELDARRRRPGRRPRAPCSGMLAQRAPRAPDRARRADLLAAQLRRRAPALPRLRGPGVDDRRRGRDPGPGQARLRGRARRRDDRAADEPPVHRRAADRQARALGDRDRPRRARRSRRSPSTSRRDVLGDLAEPPRRDHRRRRDERADRARAAPSTAWRRSSSPTATPTAPARWPTASAAAVVALDDLPDAARAAPTSSSPRPPRRTRSSASRSSSSSCAPASGRPLLLVDIAVPRDIDPACARHRRRDALRHGRPAGARRAHDLRSARPRRCAPRRSSRRRSSASPSGSARSRCSRRSARCASTATRSSSRCWPRTPARWEQRLRARRRARRGDRPLGHEPPAARADAAPAHDGRGPRARAPADHARAVRPGGRARAAERGRRRRAPARQRAPAAAPRRRSECGSGRAGARWRSRRRGRVAALLGADAELVDDHDDRRPRRAAGERQGALGQGARAARCWRARSTSPCTAPRTCPSELPDGLELVGAPPRGDPLRRARAARASLAALRAGRARRDRVAAPRGAAAARCARTSRSSACAATSTRACASSPTGDARRARARRRRAAAARARATRSAACSTSSCPPPGQGTLALEARAGDGARRRRGARDHRRARRWDALLAERACVARLDASCNTPLGAHATLGATTGSSLRTFVGLPDGSAWLRDETPPAPTPEAAGAARRRAPAAPPAAATLLRARRGARGAVTRLPRRRRARATRACMTARALELIARADVILYDRLIPDGALDGARAGRGADRRRQGRRRRAGAAGGDERAAARARARRARRSCALKGGDPFVFGRGGEEAQLLRARRASTFEVVPGVTAGVAAPAYAGIPVTQRGMAAAVAFVTGHEDPDKAETQIDWPALAAFPGTLVFYMGVRKLDRDRRAARRRRPRRRASRSRSSSAARSPTSARSSATLADIAAARRRGGRAGAGDHGRRRGRGAARRARLVRAPAARRAAASSSPAPARRPARWPARLRALGARVVEAPAIRIEPLDGRRCRDLAGVRPALRDEPQRRAPAAGARRATRARWPGPAIAAIGPGTARRAARRRDRGRHRAAARGRRVARRMIEANGVELCAEAFGDPRDPPILLIMGIGASMLWWEEGFCEMLADGGRFVIRYDHRDTGRSVTYEPGRPEYTGADLVADAAGVLDAYELAAGHIVGVSAGGAFAQLLALDAPDRVLSLTLISTSPAVPIERALPPPTEEFGRFVSTAQVDWSDADSVIDNMVDYTRVLAGGERPFDEDAARDLMRRDIERARNFAALQNHDAIAGRRARARAAVVDRRAHARRPWHRGPDVPGRARRGARGRRSPAPACSDSRAPATGSTGMTGTSSSERSSSRPRSVWCIVTGCRSQKRLYVPGHGEASGRRRTAVAA